MNQLITKHSNVATVVKLAVTLAACIGMYFYLRDRFELEALRRTMTEMALVEVLILVAINALLALIKSYNWKAILENTTNAQIHLSECLFPILAAAPLNIVLPAKSGEIVRFIHLKDKVSVDDRIGSVIFERLVDLGILISIALISGLFQNLPLSALATIAAMLISVIAITLYISKEGGFAIIQKLPIPLPSRFITIANNIMHFFNSLKQQKQTVHLFVFLSAAQWVICVGQAYLILRFMSTEVPILTIALIVPIGILLSLIPISFGGLGTREAAFLFLFDGILSPEKIIAFALFFYLIRYILPGIVGLPFILSIKSRAT